MQCPYQCIESLNRVGTQEVQLLLAASAHNLLTVDLTSGDIVSTWSAAPASSSPPEGQSAETLEGPPEKKRKLAEDSTSPPKIIKLAVSSDGQHAVAVTGEDKCVRVFSVSPSGELMQLSERSMPKRPCAISITQDSQSVICADKFGDVYALPLRHTAEDEQAFASQAEQAPKTFVPSATNLTVHTARNRRALEAQLKQEAHGKTKEPLRFKHEVLIGHVSMLTDLVLVTLEHEDLKAELNGAAAAPAGPRNYILTSDRDEHIRISRGQPQSHIIEGFCLGHKEFVSKMCLVTPQILVSGGGDDHLFVWDWLKGHLLRKLAIRDILASISEIGEFSGDKMQDGNIAVSGIWGFPKQEKEKRGIFVALEGVPALLCIRLEALRGADAAQATAIPFSGNVLDVAVADDWIAVSLDNVHVPGSTSRVRSENELEEATRLVCMGGFSEGEATIAEQAAVPGKEQLARPNARVVSEAVKADELGELLYGIANLRKRGGAGDD